MFQSSRAVSKRSNAAIILDKLMFKIKQMAEEKEKAKLSSTKEGKEDSGSSGNISQAESAVVTPDNMVSYSDVCL